MRTRTTTERNTIKAARVNHHLRVEVENADRTWKDLTNLFGVDWVESAEWGEEVDQPTGTYSVSLRRDTADVQDLSLAPPWGGSPLNRDDSLAYAPLLEPGRNVRISTAVTAPGVAPVSGDWKMMMLGPIDSVEWRTSPVVVTGRDMGGWLVDRYIEEERAYATDQPTPLEDVIQAILNDWPPTPMTTPTLYVPAPTLWMINNTQQKTQARKPVLEAIQQDWALSIGWVCRYRHDASDNYVLTLYEPDRTNTTPDETFAPTEYRDITALQTSKADVRNRVHGICFGPDKTRYETTFNDTASQAKYGIMFMEIALAPGDQIDSQLELDDLCSKAGNDLSTPYSTHTMETLYYWPVQLGDLHQYLANADHYDSDQTLAVVGYRHRFAGGEGVTEIMCAGKIKGAYRAWFRRGSGYQPGLPPSPSFVVTAADSPDGGVAQDASVFVEVQFEPNTEYCVICSETGPTLPVADPDQSDQLRNYTVRRPDEGTLTADPNWKTMVRIATTQGWYRNLLCFGVGYDGQRSKPFKTTIQAGSTVPPTSPTIPNGFTAVGGERLGGGTTGHIFWSGTPTPGVANEQILIWRDGVIIATLDVNAIEFFDPGISTDTTYTYEIARFAGGQYGPRAIWVLDTWITEAPIPLPVFANGTPLLQTTSYGQRLVQLAWTCADASAAQLDIETSLDGMTWGTVIEVITSPLAIASGSTVDADLTRKYYRFTTRDGSGNVRAHSDPALWPGVQSAGGASQGNTGYTPTFTLALHTDSLGAYDGILITWRCSDPSAVSIRIQDDVDGDGVFTDYIDIAGADSGAYVYADYADVNAFRVQALDASNAVLTTSAPHFWKGWGP
jgi:hypothetical protein